MITPQLIRLISEKMATEKLNNRELAALVESTEHTIGNILRAKIRWTDPELLERIMKWLGVRLVYLPQNADTGIDLIRIPAGMMLTVKLPCGRVVTCDPKALLKTGSKALLRRREEGDYLVGKAHVVSDGFLVVTESGDSATVMRANVEFVAPIVEEKSMYEV